MTRMMKSLRWALPAMMQRTTMTRTFVLDLTRTFRRGPRPSA